ncbi:SDR family NAD(P)-dependent oxidoreductase [Hyphomonas oceanitis]|uniref:Short chain dehydrogenase n=1 Tax=Hyphomonas oceanitis SCH89 TaxID=1280953 RepID=A0A059G5L0_9PROT|nr:SDR family NAD(P)-dependent oxidoreductase [Hyphomonas oceanitis]KDA01753.1 short chain dehydrogenase [Hyphomonas oceanitis SCH89]|tara:strand:- start:6507 stop:7334 length:828 start_codon:yes stop_codon:yes gene_type:complete
MTDTPIHPALTAGRLAIVTGGASGIGLPAAHRFKDLGLTVCILDRNLSSLDIEGHGFIVHEQDISDARSVSALAASLIAEHGPPAVLMNNAGIGGGGDILADIDAWEAVIATNLMGMVYGLKAFLPAMLAGDQPGLIINTGSKQGITQPPGNTAYNVSKSGVKALTEGLAHTLRDKTGSRITAHLLIPGFTYTGMIARHIPTQPPGAWSSEQVVDFMMQSLDRGDFYILCPDNDTPRETDEKRILWNAGDIIENRPALSRWHPDYKDAFDAFMVD